VSLGLLLLAAQDVGVAADGTRETWRLLELPPPWVIVLVLIPLVALVSYVGYWRESLGRGPRSVLVGLRAASLVLLLIILFRPVTVRHQENVKRPQVAVLVDDSASMRRIDAYAGDAPTRSALEALVDTPLASATRLDLVRAGLERELLPAIEAQGYEVKLFRFAEGLTRLEGLQAASGKGSATHIGDALTQALARLRGMHVTDVVILSDGRNNGGVPMLDAAAAAGVAVHTVVVGDTRPEQNLSVELVDSPDGVLEGDEIAISVRIQATGLAGGGVTQIVLEELEPDGAQPRTVAQSQVDLADVGDRIVLIAPPGRAGLSSTGRRFRISVQPLPEETMLDDNSLELSVHVTPEKIRVLYIDGYPRYEYRYLQKMLKRADERIQVQVWLESATPNFIQESTRGVPSLLRLPSSRRELLDNYDVIILGDVNPNSLFNDPARATEFVASLFEFVERGGGLCFIAGEYDMPRTINGTELAKLLPVRLDPAGSLPFEGDTKTEYRPVLEDPANPHEIVRLHPDPETNRRLIEEPGGLNGWFWYSPVLDAKPGAQVLLRHPQHENQNGRYPLLVTGYYPAGRTMFLAVDSTWRWRFRYVDRYHERFWRNAIRWLALGRLKSGDRRYGLEPLRNVYSLEERVTLEARILDEDYHPSEEAQQEAYLAGPSGPPRPLRLTRVEGRPGLFRGTFVAERPGIYRAWIEVGGRRMATTELEVVLPSRETADPSPDPGALADLARMTGGRAVALADIARLRTEFPGDEERREPISSQLKDAWDNWGTLLFALALLSTEWVMRKRYELI